MLERLEIQTVSLFQANEIVNFLKFTTANLLLCNLTTESAFQVANNYWEHCFASVVKGRLKPPVGTHYELCSLFYAYF